MEKVKFKEGEKTVSCLESQDEMMITEVTMVPTQPSFSGIKVEWPCLAEQTGWTDRSGNLKVGRCRLKSSAPCRLTKSWKKIVARTQGGGRQARERTSEKLLWLEEIIYISAFQNCQGVCLLHVRFHLTKAKRGIGQVFRVWCLPLPGLDFCIWASIWPQAIPEAGSPFTTG